MTLPLPYKYLFRLISIVTISGFATQYFFLAAFTLMCAMSCEVWLQLRYGKYQFKKVIQMLIFSFFVFSEVMQPMKSVIVLKFGLAMSFHSYFLSLLVLWKPLDLDVHQWHPNLQKKIASFHVCTFYNVIDLLFNFIQLLRSKFWRREQSFSKTANFKIQMLLPLDRPKTKSYLDEK